MSSSELTGEFTNLKEEFKKFTSIFEILIQKYSTLEQKYEKSLERGKKPMFKCSKCDEELENTTELKKHRESCRGTHECEECGKCFKEELHLENHMKRVHRKFECDECDKVFKYEANLEKHVAAVHEDVELYCHYYNNDKECPYGDECIFMHEESENCKYGKTCDRVMCMFRHDVEGDSDDESAESGTNQSDVSSENIVPSLEQITKSLEKVAILLKKVVPILKCEQCEFEARNQNGLTMHMKAKHTETKAN